jgi:hypothetical protein
VCKVYTRPSSCGSLLADEQAAGRPMKRKRRCTSLALVKICDPTRPGTSTPHGSAARLLPHYNHTSLITGGVQANCTGIIRVASQMLGVALLGKRVASRQLWIQCVLNIETCSSFPCVKHSSRFRPVPRAVHREQRGVLSQVERHMQAPAVLLLGVRMHQGHRPIPLCSADVQPQAGPD